MIPRQSNTFRNAEWNTHHKNDDSSCLEYQIGTSFRSTNHRLTFISLFSCYRRVVVRRLNNERQTASPPKRHRVSVLLCTFLKLFLHHQVFKMVVSFDFQAFISAKFDIQWKQIRIVSAPNFRSKLFFGIKFELICY